MNRILDIDEVAGTARVEAGVVLDALQSATDLHGPAFGPDPSSHSRCTLGGMIGNDACGNRSVRYGRTSSHIEALEIVTADGVRAVADRTGLHPVDLEDAERVARLDADVRRLVGDNPALIRTELGRIPRQVSGCQLHHLLPERGSTWPALWWAPRVPVRSSPPRRSAWWRPHRLRHCSLSATTTSSTRPRMCGRSCGGLPQPWRAPRVQQRLDRPRTRYHRAGRGCTGAGGSGLRRRPEPLHRIPG